MDYHLLAILEEPDDSDFDSDTEFPTVVSGLTEFQPRNLVNQAKFPDRPFRPGNIRSARLAGDSDNQGLIPVVVSTQTPTTNPTVSGGIQPSLGAIPRIQTQSKTPKAKKKAPQAPTTPFQGELEDIFIEDPNPAGSYYTTPDKKGGFTAQFERKLRELLPRAFQPDPPVNPDFARTGPPSYDQIMAEGGGNGLGGNDIPNLGNQAGLVDPNPNLQQQNVVTEGGTPGTTIATPSDNQVAIPTTATAQVAIPTTANAQVAIPTTATEQFSDGAGAFASIYARRLAHEAEERRLSSTPRSNLRIRPFTTDEREWVKSIYNTVGGYADKQERNMGMAAQNERFQGSPNPSVGDNYRENEVVPQIFLFKTTREDNGISPHQILPEEYNPLRSRIPHPISEPSGVLPMLDGETTSEMLVKVSIMGIISENPNISPEHLINHLRSFIFRSRAINDEFLNRVHTRKVIIPEEANKAIKLFQDMTSPSLNKLDEYLLGRSRWKNFHNSPIRESVQRFLVWVLDLNQHEKQMGWSAREWSQLSAKDMSLFYHCLFFYPSVFALSCLILWKQMGWEDMEARLAIGGLSKIPPAALMNFLRIYMLRLGEFGWMNGDLVQNIPHVNKDEWTIILANCTEEEQNTMINVYQRPGSLMPNHGNGRATPIRAYQQILGNEFNKQVRLGQAQGSGNNNQIPSSNMMRQPHTYAPTSNPNMQGQIQIFGQNMQNNPLSNASMPHTSSLQHNSIPTTSIPALQPPRVTNTSTINTNVAPRMSSGVITLPTSFMPSNPFLQAHPQGNSPLQNIGNMEYEYNSNNFIPSSLSNIPHRNANPFTGSTNIRQNTLPSTLPTSTLTQTNNTTTNSNPQLPSLEELYEDEGGNRDYKALFIHALAKLEAHMDLAKPNTHKMNYGRVPPPVLTLDNELRSTTYQLWRGSWLDFFEKAKMHDSEGLAFLKEQSITDKGLKTLISVCESVPSAFELLDTQFGDKEAELRLIKSQICDHPMLTDNYDFDYQIGVVQKILQYVTIFNRLFLPQGEDFHAFELNNSMMSWIPKA